MPASCRRRRSEVHGSMFSQRDAYLFHAEQFVQQEIHGLVG